MWSFGNIILKTQLWICKSAPVTLGPDSLLWLLEASTAQLLPCLWSPLFPVASSSELQTHQPLFKSMLYAKLLYLWDIACTVRQSRTFSSQLCPGLDPSHPSLLLCSCCLIVPKSATPWTAAHQFSSSFTISWSLLKFMSIESVMLSNHLILFHPLLLPSIFPSIRVFSNESALCTRWPTYRSFNFSISPSSEYSRLISFRINSFDLLAVRGTLKSLLQHHSSKASSIILYFKCHLPWGTIPGYQHQVKIRSTLQPWSSLP